MIVNSISNKLSECSVLIGDVQIDLEHLTSFEIVYESDTPKIIGTLIFDDIFDISLIQDWKDSDVRLLYTDAQNSKIDRNFKIIDISEKQTNKKQKVFIIEVQDIFSYTLEKSFLSKSFDSTLKDAIEFYVNELGLSNYKLEISNVSDTYQFVVPSNINNLDFFLKEFRKHGFSFYQNKDNIIIKSVDDILPSELPLNEQDQSYFTDEVANKFFKNRIFDSTKQFLRRQLMQSKTKAIAYDINTKKMLSVEKNSINEFSLNNDKVTTQEENGLLYKYQQHTNFEEYRADMRDMFQDQNTIDIVVNGYRKNDIRQVYDLRFAGNKSTIQGINTGNIILSGKYVSTRIVEKIIKDTLIQKITLKRVDMQKRIS